MSFHFSFPKAPIKPHPLDMFPTQDVPNATHSVCTMSHTSMDVVICGSEVVGGGRQSFYSLSNVFQPTLHLWLVDTDDKFEPCDILYLDLLRVQPS